MKTNRTFAQTALKDMFNALLEQVSGDVSLQLLIRGIPDMLDVPVHQCNFDLTSLFAANSKEASEVKKIWQHELSGASQLVTTAHVVPSVAEFVFFIFEHFTDSSLPHIYAATKCLYIQLIEFVDQVAPHVWTADPTCIVYKFRSWTDPTRRQWIADQAATRAAESAAKQDHHGFSAIMVGSFEAKVLN